MAKNIVKCLVALTLSVAVLFGSTGAVNDYQYETPIECEVIFRPFDIGKKDGD